MQWPDLVAALGFFAQQEQPDSSWTGAFPTFVINAENRIFRDLDLQATSGDNFSLSTAAFSNIVDLAPMNGQTVQGTAVAFGYPVTVQEVSAKVGNRWIPYVLASAAWLNAIWPDETQGTTPTVGTTYYNMQDQRTIQIAPVPDNNYPLRITGMWRPAPMSATNPETYLGDFFPDLLLAAVLVEAMNYQRDPQTAGPWEARYQDVLRGAKREEALKQGLGPDYQPIPPAPMAHPAPMPPPG